MLPIRAPRYRDVELSELTGANRAGALVSGEDWCIVDAISDGVRSRFSNAKLVQLTRLIT